MLELNVLSKIIDSKDFTVGGGSASALSGAMAAGMVSMVCRLSTKKDYEFPKEYYENIADECDELAKKLTVGSDEDTKAYCLIKDAYTLPKSTDEEIVIRKTHIQNAGIKAASVPLENAKLCKRVCEIYKTIKDKSNPNAGTDLDIAGLLAEIGVKGCVLNIEANLPLIKDEEILENFNEEMKNLNN
ncbi:MAG: cyclodeaminase/cyclohydrolase family protein [Romboutsia sp.]